MNSKKFTLALTIGALLVVSGSNAMADDKWLGDQGDNWQQHIVSAKTRAQVKEELAQSRAQGYTIGGQELDYPRTPSLMPGRSPGPTRGQTQRIQNSAGRDNVYSIGQ